MLPDEGYQSTIGAQIVADPLTVGVNAYVHAASSEVKGDKSLRPFRSLHFCPYRTGSDGFERCLEAEALPSRTLARLRRNQP